VPSDAAPPPTEETIMKLLHLDSSALGTQSVTRELTAAIVGQWRDSRPGVAVDYRDLDADPIPHLSGQSLAKADPAAANADERILQQFLDADVVVIGAPFYNFGIPSTLKAWIDRIAVAGRTFRYTDKGPEGLAGGKQVIIASGRGGAYGDKSPADFQEAYLRQVFGFLGVTDLHIVRAEGVAMSPQHRTEALAKAHASIPQPLALAA
jgi:FMN-dependent NADH-azoreductase